jgi:hypothetical protein
MYWQLFQIIIVTFVPFVPVNPVIRHHPDLTKYLWTFECNGFDSIYDFFVKNQGKIKNLYSKMKLFYTDTMAARQLENKNC